MDNVNRKRAASRDFASSAARMKASFAFALVSLPETGSPSSGKGLSSFCGPRGHEARHGIPCAADAPKMIGVFDHQLYWLFPQIITHVVTSGVFAAEETRSLPTRSGHRTKVPVRLRLKAREATMTLEARPFTVRTERIAEGLGITPREPIASCRRAASLSLPARAALALV